MGNAERSAIAFAKHHVADGDAGGLADALALALYLRRTDNYCPPPHESQVGAAMDTGVPGRVSGCDHCKL